jgi:flagellar motility protein MotE (MotC chaperone)
MAEVRKMKSRVFLLTGCILLLVAAVSLVKAEEPAKAVPPPATASAEAKKASTPIALTMEAIQELEERKAALDLREKQLAEKARGLELQEKILKEKLKKMEDLNKKMAERLDLFKKDHEQRITKLVTVVEGMKPEMAARYVEALDPDLAVEILARIKEQKASKIMNLVDKKLSAKLTELYTGYRDSAEEAPAPPPAATPAVPPISSAKEAAQPTNKPM